MMRILWILAILLISVWIGIKLSNDPGYILITFNHWTIQTTAWVGLIGLLLLCFLIHSVLSIIHFFNHLPAQCRDWRAKRRALKAQAKTRQGLIEFSEGYWASAKNHLIKALPDTDMPLLNYLTAARAAQEMGENQLRDDYLREAQQSMPEAKIAVELTQAQLQLANQQWEQALATLRHLQDLAPRHPYVLKLLMHLYQEVRDWPQLITLLPELQKNNILQPQGFEKLRHHTYLQALNDLIRTMQPDNISHFINTLPKILRHDNELMHCYCQFLLTIHQIDLTETILRRCLQRQFSDKLICLYGMTHASINKQLAFAESLLKKHTNSANLYICLGRLSRLNHLWGKARTYFDQSIAIKPSTTAYAEMGELLNQLGEHNSASLAFQQGLALVL